MPKPVSRVDQFSEYVDDSEPEREERRRRHRTEKLSTKQRHRTPAQSSGAVSKFQPESQVNLHSRVASPRTASSLEISVIEISDTTEDEHAIPEEFSAAQLRLLGDKVIDISDDISHLTPKPSSRVQHTYKTTSVPVQIIVEPSLPDALSSPVRGRLFLDNNEDSDNEFRLKLGQFAYAQDVPPSKLSRSHNSSRASSTSGVVSSADPVVPAVKKTVKTTRKTKPRLVPDIPDSNLAALLKCPSCEIAWTIRKTGPNKLAHIQTCARKKGHTQESLQLLIQRDLAAQPQKPKAKCMSTVAEVQPPKTFLEEVVEDAGPKKKHRRPDVQATVVGLSQTRNGILDRARSLLGGTRPAPALESTQASGQIKLAAALQSAEWVQPPPTQPFGRSALAQRLAMPQSDGGSSGYSSTCEDEDDEPLTTQAFHHPELMVKNQHGRGSPISISSSSDDDVHPCTSSSRDPSPIPRLPNTLPGRGLPPRSLPSPSRLSQSRGFHETEEARSLDLSDEHRHPVEDVDPFAWANDDVYVHFDPDMERQQGAIHQYTTGLGKVDFHGDASVAGRGSASSAVRAKPQRKKTAKGKKKQVGQHTVDATEAADDATLNAKLKELILQDVELHHRILRYEPINFETFMTMASTLNVSSRGLKLKVWAFLDEQAVNFFGAEPGGSRTRKQRT